MTALKKMHAGLFLSTSYLFLMDLPGLSQYNANQAPGWGEIKTNCDWQILVDDSTHSEARAGPVVQQTAQGIFCSAHNSVGGCHAGNPSVQ